MLQKENPPDVKILTNIQAPYRLPLWELLGEKVKLTILLQAKNENDREWNNQKEFKHIRIKYLKGITFNRLNKNHLNVSFLRHLKPNDVLLIGGYANFTEILSILYLKFIRRQRFGLIYDGGFYRNENALLFKLKSFFIKCASIYLASGANAARTLSIYGARPERINNAYLTVDTEYFVNESHKFNKARLKQDFNINGAAVLCVSRLIKDKGIMDLLKAIERIQMKITLILVGTGKDEHIFKKYAREKNMNNVIFAGYKQMDEIGLYYSLADIFVLPTHYDPWGLVINEALCFGLPVITTDMAGAAYDLIKNGENGYVVTAKDTDELSLRIQELSDSSEKRIQFGKKSLEIIKEWNLGKSVAAYIKCINILSKINNLSKR